MSDEGRQYDSGEEHTGDVVKGKPNDKNITSDTTNELPEETTTSATDGGDSKNDNIASTSSSLGKGLSYTISTIIRDFDSQAQQTSRSKDQLSSSIDRLTRGKWRLRIFKPTAIRDFDNPALIHDLMFNFPAKFHLTYL